MPFFLEPCTIWCRSVTDYIPTCGCNNTKLNFREIERATLFHSKTNITIIVQLCMYFETCFNLYFINVSKAKYLNMLL